MSDISDQYQKELYPRQRLMGATRPKQVAEKLLWHSHSCLCTQAKCKPLSQGPFSQTLLVIQ
jgi:hypothetical protein